MGKNKYTQNFGMDILEGREDRLGNLNFIMSISVII